MQNFKEKGVAGRGRSGLGPPLNPLLGLSRILSSQQKCWLRGGVGGQFPRNPKLILKGCVHTLLQSMRGSSTRSLTWKRIIKQPKKCLCFSNPRSPCFFFLRSAKIKVTYGRLIAG